MSTNISSSKALVALLPLALLFAACASTRNEPPKKVQTMHELMVKLKKGFDEGHLDDAKFYEKELGYVLDKPYELKVVPPPYTARQEIRFDEGQLQGWVAYVGALQTKEGKVVNFSTYGRSGEHCFSSADMEAIWGIQEGRDLWTAHGLSPEINYMVRKSYGRNDGIAQYSLYRDHPRCLVSISISKYFN